MNHYSNIQIDDNFISPDALIIDNTKRSSYEVCPRYCYYTHVRGLHSRTGSPALRYGSAWHSILEHFYDHIKEKGWAAKADAISLGILKGYETFQKESQDFDTFIDDYRTFKNCTEAFIQYLTTFTSDEGLITITDTEKPFKHTITLDSQLEEEIADSLPPIYFTGKIDLRVKMGGVPYIEDHKSTGMYLSTVVPTMQRSAQIMGYSYVASRDFEEKPEGCLINLHQITSKRKKDGDWGKLSIDFARIPMIYTEYDLLQWKLSFLNTCAKLWRSYCTNFWPMNHESCFRFNKPCGFTGLCQQNCALEDLNVGEYTVKFWDVLKED